MGAIVGLAIIITLLYLEAYARVPAVGLILLLVYVLFFQVGKDQFRKRYWKNQQSGSAVERMTDWVDMSLQQWTTFFEAPSRTGFNRLVSQSVDRLSLMPLSTVVIRHTPDSVPFQGTRLYGYMVVTLIPRALWPEKPSLSEANRYLQVAYGFTRPADLDKISISIGILMEAYVIFGWAGIVAVMFFGVCSSPCSKRCL